MNELCSFDIEDISSEGRTHPYIRSHLVKQVEYQFQMSCRQLMILIWFLYPKEVLCSILRSWHSHHCVIVCNMHYISSHLSKRQKKSHIFKWKFLQSVIYVCVYLIPCASQKRYAEETQIMCDLLVWQVVYIMLSLLRFSFLLLLLDHWSILHPCLAEVLTASS
jgi:hypothetical protein